MFSLVIYGVVAVFVLTFVLLRQLTSRKQRELNAQEFEAWFERNYMGMNYPLVRLFEGSRSETRPDPILERSTSAKD
jgi:hypothetical protein